MSGPTLYERLECEADLLAQRGHKVARDEIVLTLDTGETERIPFWWIKTAERTDECRLESRRSPFPFVLDDGVRMRIETRGGELFKYDGRRWRKYSLPAD